ncbi:MFS transporter [Microbispora triticiradicis]|uniref:MFS transporter n=2 Tax=Microbispora TaxID=2005 RepID=A0ABY3LSU1_9ACTN|nr:MULTISPECIES: MFS transporter [Microbispora]TLP62482.1 MFS transporter [Microbispora fusca]TYB52011.1 MFS transporter [Microbispora tritici]
MPTTVKHRFLINRDYARLWYGQAVSSTGDVVFSTTLVLWVADVLAKDQSWAPAAVSGILLAVGGAVLFVGPIAGVFVDRWDKMRTMLGTEVIRGVVVAFLTVVALLPADAIPVWAWLALIYTSVLVLNATGQFFGPARLSIIRDIVTGEADRARAAGIAQGTAGAIAIVGPPLAAPLMFSVGLQWALLLNAASYAVSYAVIRSVRRDSAPDRGRSDGSQPGLRKEFVVGLRFFAGSRFLVALLTLAVIGQCGLGALNTLNVFFLTENLHSPSHLFGYLGTAEGVGGIIGALCAGRVVQWIGARRTAWIGLIVSGALLLTYTRQTEFLGGLIVLSLFVIPITMLNTAMTPLLLAAAPKEYLGRVMAVFYPVTQLASMLAASAAGWLASTDLRNLDGSLAGMRFGPIDSILALSGVLILIAGVYARAALTAAERSTSAAPAAEHG